MLTSGASTWEGVTSDAHQASLTWERACCDTYQCYSKSEWGAGWDQAASDLRGARRTLTSGLSDLEGAPSDGDQRLSVTASVAP